MRMRGIDPCIQCYSPGATRVVHPSPYCGLVRIVNASRFDHSYKPTLVISFNGTRLVVKYVDQWPKEESDEAASKRMTKKEVEALTFDYRFGMAWNYGTSFSTTKQRNKSLQARLFFRCRCSICANRITDLLQNHSSPLACSQYHQPYIWQKHWWTRGCKLSNICRCPWNPDMANSNHWCHDRQVQLGARRIFKVIRGEAIMEKTVNAKSPAKTIEIGEPFLPVAVKY